MQQDPNLAGKCYKYTFQIMQDIDLNPEEINNQTIPIEHIESVLKIDISNFDIDQDLRLVHGHVKHPKNHNFIAHAWIEIYDQYVYDPVGGTIEIPATRMNRETYYNHYHCETEPMNKFSRSTTVRLLQTHYRNDEWFELTPEQIREAIKDIYVENYVTETFFDFLSLNLK